MAGIGNIDMDGKFVAIKMHFHDHGDVWHNSNPNVSWAETLEHAEKIGVVTRQYELITMK